MLAVSKIKSVIQTERVDSEKTRDIENVVYLNRLLAHTDAQIKDAYETVCNVVSEVLECYQNSSELEFAIASYINRNFIDVTVLKIRELLHTDIDTVFSNRMLLHTDAQIKDAYETVRAVNDKNAYYLNEDCNELEYAIVCYFVYDRLV